MCHCVGWGHSKTILILGWFYPYMKALALCMDPNGIKNKHIVKYLYPFPSKKHEILIIGTQMVLGKDDTSPMLDEIVGFLLLWGKCSIKSSLACRASEVVLKVGWNFWDFFFSPPKLWENIEIKNRVCARDSMSQSQIMAYLRLVWSTHPSRQTCF